MNIKLGEKESKIKQEIETELDNKDEVDTAMYFFEKGKTNLSKIETMLPSQFEEINNTFDRAKFNFEQSLEKYFLLEIKLIKFFTYLYENKETKKNINEKLNLIDKKQEKIFKWEGREMMPNY